MLQKTIKFFLVLIAIGLVTYHSVYIKKRNDFNDNGEKAFDAKAYAEKYIFKTIPASANKAVDFAKFSADFNANPKQTFNYAHGQSAGDVRYVLVKGKGKVIKVDKSEVMIRIPHALSDVKIATEYIFGNAARDGSGLISINDFNNTMQLNDLSEEINKLIRAKILLPFKSSVKKDDEIEFLGVIELDETVLKPESFELTPLKLTKRL